MTNQGHLEPSSSNPADRYDRFNWEPGDIVILDDDADDLGNLVLGAFEAELEKFNENHDEQGRFASGGGGAATATPEPGVKGDVSAYLHKNYPPHVLGWVGEANWHKAEAVPLSMIDYARRPGGRDEARTEGLTEAVRAGKVLSPAVLVAKPNGRFALADGYHRTKAYERAGRKTIAAYVATGINWTPTMERNIHAAKLNKDVGDAMIEGMLAAMARLGPDSPDAYVNKSVADYMLAGLEAALFKGNPNHAPAGTPEGGQFTSGEGGGDGPDGPTDGGGGGSSERAYSEDAAKQPEAGGGKGVPEDRLATNDKTTANLIKNDTLHEDAARWAKQFDTAKVKADRAIAQHMPLTDKIDTAERNKLRNDITDATDARFGMHDDKTIEEVYGTKNPTIAQGKEIFLVFGPPAAGKSSRVANELLKQHNARLIDSDEIKMQLPEYRGGVGANAVHNEASAIAESRLLGKAMDRGDNIVWPMLGKSDKSGLVDHLVKEGYKVHIDYVDLPLVKAAANGLDRHEKTGRFIDPENIRAVDHLPTKFYNQLKRYPGVTSYRKVSTDVPFNQKYKVVEQGGQRSRSQAKR